MGKGSLAALLAMLGLDAKNPAHGPLLDLLGGKSVNFDAPDPEHLTQTAGCIVAAWYSIHAISVDVCVVDPVSGNIQTRFSHPALGPQPSCFELWDYLYICLSGMATKMAHGQKVRGAEYVEVLRQARALAETLASRSPFQPQPWTDTARVGKFSVTQMFSTKPPSLVGHILDVSYRQARHMSASRTERIQVLSDTLQKKGLMLDSDFLAVLGPRTFATK